MFYRINIFIRNNEIFTPDTDKILIFVEYIYNHDTRSLQKWSALIVIRMDHNDIKVK